MTQITLRKKLIQISKIIHEKRTKFPVMCYNHLTTTSNVTTSNTQSLTNR